MMRMTKLITLIILCFATVISFAAERPIIALLSDDTQSYLEPLKAFKEKINQPVMTYNLKGDIKNAPEIMNNILDQNPSVIFALGAKAAWFAKTSTKKRTEVTVLFAMVLNHQRYQLDDGQVNVTGVSADIAPGTQLFNLSLFSPEVKRIGVIYSPEHSGKSLVIAQKAADLLGLEIIKQPIKRAKEFTLAWQQLSDKIDAYWVLNDPVIYTLDNIYWIKDRCLKERLICAGQSDNISRLGVLLAINPDISNIGVQAASMVEDILNKRVRTSDLGIKTPIGTHITLNASTARKIGLSISSSASSLVNEIIEK